MNKHVYIKLREFIISYLAKLFYCEIISEYIDKFARTKELTGPTSAEVIDKENSLVIPKFKKIEDSIHKPLYDKMARKNENTENKYN